MHFSTTRLLLVLFIATYLRKGETSVVYFECPDNHPEIAYIEIGPLRPSSVKGRDPDSPDWKNVTMTKITLLCKTNATWVYPGGEVKVKIIGKSVNRNLIFDSHMDIGQSQKGMSPAPRRRP